MKKDPKKGFHLSFLLLLISGILLYIAYKLPNENIVEKYGMIINKGNDSILEIILIILGSIFFIASFVVEKIMCRCEHCNHYISMRKNIKYCPYCSKEIK